MKTIRTLLTSTVAITLAASTLPSNAFGDDSQAEPAAAPMAATSDAIEPGCERIQRIGKFVMTRCR